MTTNGRRVVVTGLGCVSPVGNSVSESWASVLAGRSGIDFITRFDASQFACRFAGEVRGLDLSPHISVKEARTMDSFIHYGIMAAAEAVADAGLPIPRRPGLLDRAERAGLPFRLAGGR